MWWYSLWRVMYQCFFFLYDVVVLLTVIKKSLRLLQLPSTLHVSCKTSFLVIKFTYKYVFSLNTVVFATKRCQNHLNYCHETVFRPGVAVPKNHVSSSKMSVLCTPKACYLGVECWSGMLLLFQSFTLAAYWKRNRLCFVRRMALYPLLHFLDTFYASFRDFVVTVRRFHGPFLLALGKKHITTKSSDVVVLCLQQAARSPCTVSCCCWNKLANNWDAVDHHESHNSNVCVFRI